MENNHGAQGCQKQDGSVNTMNLVSISMCVYFKKQRLSFQKDESSGLTRVPANAWIHAVGR